MAKANLISQTIENHLETIRAQRYQGKLILKHLEVEKEKCIDAAVAKIEDEYLKIESGLRGWIEGLDELGAELEN